jgi:hypothetical protein
MNTNSHQSLPDIHKDIWFKILKVCEPDLLYSMYLVNKLFQQIIEDMKLLPPLWICSMRHPDNICEYIMEKSERFAELANDFLSHYKLLPRTKHYKLDFLTYIDFLRLFRNSQLSSMINMLEIDISTMFCAGYDYQSIIEKVLQFPNITMLSLVNATVISRDFPEICSKNHFLRYLNLCSGIWSSFLNFSTCSFVNFSLDNMICKSGTSIKMPDCLKKCYLYCYLMEVELLSNSSIEFHMSHCKELKTL